MLKSRLSLQWNHFFGQILVLGIDCIDFFKKLFTQEKEKIRFKEPIEAKKIREIAEHNISKEELQQGVIISEDSVSKIKQFIENKKTEGLTRFDNSRNLVFTLDSDPEYVFKALLDPIFGKVLSSESRYQNMILAKTVCRTHQLGLLVIPNAKLFTVEVNGKNYEFIAEKKLDIISNESLHEELLEKEGARLNETIRQLAVFICKIGYGDVEWRNNPILNNSLSNGQRKIALIDLENMNENEKEMGLFGGYSKGLVACVNEEQGKIVEKIAKENGVSTSKFFEASKKRGIELENYRKIQLFYKKNSIENGNEPLKVDINTLGLDLNEEVEHKGEKFIMKDVVMDIIKIINSRIEFAPKDDSPKSKRCILLSFSADSSCQKYSTLGHPKDEDFNEKNIWLHRIITSLVEKGYLFKLNSASYHGYEVQA